MESILAMVPDGRGLLDFYRVGDDLEFRKSMKMPYEVVGRPVIVFNGDYSWFAFLKFRIWSKIHFLGRFFLKLSFHHKPNCS